MKNINIIHDFFVFLSCIYSVNVPSTYQLPKMHDLRKEVLYCLQDAVDRIEKENPYATIDEIPVGGEWQWHINGCIFYGTKQALLPCEYMRKDLYDAWLDAHEDYNTLQDLIADYEERLDEIDNFMNDAAEVAEKLDKIFEEYDFDKLFDHLRIFESQ